MLSPKQAEFLVKSTAKINLAHGAVRSGKTHATLLRWAEVILDSPDDRLIMVGKSADSIYDNAVKPFYEELFPGYCSWSPGKRELTFANKKIRVIGANDQGAVGRIQGNTISGAYCDEMTILPTNFLDMLFSRLSLPHSKLIGTMNPDSPYHYMKAKIDMSDGKNIYALHFSLEDNPSLTEDYKDLLSKLYSGLWHRRYVLGEWVMASGAIYDGFDRNMHVVPRPPSYARYYVAGIDYGTSNPFAMVLIGVNPDVHPACWVEKEYYWDPKVMSRQKTNSEFADAIEHELEGYPVRMVYLDPSAEAFQVEMKRKGLPIKEADNDVLGGIRCVADFISQGDLVVCSEAKNLIREMESYIWDEKKVKQGWDAPLKEMDHACVVGETLIYTAGGYVPIQELCEQRANGHLLNTNDAKRSIEWDIYMNVSLTRKEAEVYELELEDGKKLIATADHRVKTRMAFLPMDQLSLMDEVFTFDVEKWKESEDPTIEAKKVISLKKIGKRDVYCLAALNNRTMIANGIITRNCDALRYALFSHFGKNRQIKVPVNVDSGISLGRRW